MIRQHRSSASQAWQRCVVHQTQLFFCGNGPRSPQARPSIPDPVRIPLVGHANEEGILFRTRALQARALNRIPGSTPGVLLSDDMPVNNSPGAVVMTFADENERERRESQRAGEKSWYRNSRWITGELALSRGKANPISAGYQSILPRNARKFERSLTFVQSM